MLATQRTPRLNDRRRRNFLAALDEVSTATNALQSAVVLAHALALNGQDHELALARAEKRLDELRRRIAFAKEFAARAVEIGR